MSEKCKTCLHQGFYDMITSRRPYCYSGPIPCYNCEELSKPHSEYVPVVGDPKEETKEEINES